MRASSTALRVVTSLRLGERVLVRSEDGLVPAEYALFDTTDIVLRATDPVSVREAGYMTTAREAIARLARAGVTPSLAYEAARALGTEVAASYARGSGARHATPRLGAYELFEGSTFSAASQTYAGAWLDLGALGSALSVANVAVAIQVLHLAAALAEVGPTTPVHLSTAAATRERRPGERTHMRVALESAFDLPEALRKLRPLAEPIHVEGGSERRYRQMLLGRVRERVTSDSAPRLRAHITTLESALATQTMQLGPLADDELRAIERQLASGDPRGIDEQLDKLEQSRGAVVGIRYLRARAALLRGDQPPRSVAQLLSELAQEEQGFHQAELGAARTWLAAGEDANARFYAHKLADNPAAPESERVIAMEILDETNAMGNSMAPSAEGDRDSYEEVGEEVLVPMAPARIPLFPSLGNMPPPQFAGSNLSSPPQPSMVPPPLPALTGSDGSMRVRGPTMTRYEPELVESLALPYGVSESALDLNELPRTPLQARIAMTRLARDLARDYRLWYGKSLRCNVLAVDAMQQHLSHRYAGAAISDENVAWELRRHASLLSEILARALGGSWVDIAPSEPGYWAMLVPPGTRIWPIGRVYRFVALGHRERDLVSYYLDIEARARGT